LASAKAPGPTAKIWRDGVLVDWADATVHVLAHAIHYGSSIFEGVRCYEGPNGGNVFRLRDHMRRLHDSAKIYRLAMKHSVDDMVQAVVETVAANDLTECYIRPLVMRSGQNMGVWARDIPVETFVICYHWPTLLGDAAMKTGADVRVSSWRRAAPDTFPTLAKAGGNYLNSQLSAMEARLDEYAEGIMLDSNGWVAEGSGQNLFVVRDGVLHTAPISSGILHGITRDSVMTFAKDLGIPVKEMVMPREFLYISDEAFFCGTAAEVTPIRSIDQLPVGDATVGPVTRKVQEHYLNIVRGKVPDKYGWLEPVPQAAHAGGAR
jgi:branched-chain amino acid aminotransferase